MLLLCWQVFSTVLQSPHSVLETLILCITSIDDDAFKHIEAIIHSMTPDERATPSKLNASRKKRIAKGAGRDVQEVNQLLKQFDQMSKMMKMMQGGGGKRMMQMMGGMKGMK